MFLLLVLIFCLLVNLPRIILFSLSSILTIFLLRISSLGEFFTAAHLSMVCIHSSQAPPLPHPLMRFLVNGLPLPIGTIGLGIQISELFVKFFPPLISLFKKIKIWLYVLHVHRPKVISFHLMFLALLLLNINFL